MNEKDILNFWFHELDKKMWFEKNSVLDKTIATRFMGVYEKAISCELFFWRKTLEGRLAEILILDQFSRNIFRHQAKAFQYDSLALALSQEASCLVEVEHLNPDKKAFLFMPFMHSESLTIHEKAVELFSVEGLESYLEFELKHKKIIQRFGRYPHRNSTLGRKSTQEEIEFLKEEGSSF